MIHELKCGPAPFQAVLDGVKHHEIRSEADGRRFAARDVLHLREWRDPAHHADVTYVSRGPDWGLPAGVAVMSIRLAEVARG